MFRVLQMSTPLARERNGKKHEECQQIMKNKETDFLLCALFLAAYPNPCSLMPGS